ncbi:MAG: hypothetical protein Sapg2KO_11290 [Saprospiraceae bacterium]
MKNYLLIILFCLLSTAKLPATAQFPDYLIYQGDTLMLFSNPLEPFFEKRNSREIPNFGGCHTTASWRGYIAWWELRNDSLFLLKIAGCSFNEETDEQADLHLLFPERETEKNIFADWLDGLIFNPYGERLHYEHMGYASIYQYERVFTFQKGILKKIKVHQNKVLKSPLSDNTDSLLHFLFQNIHWNELPELQEGAQAKVLVQFKTDQNGHIQLPKIVRSSGQVYETETLRLLKQLAFWNTYVRRGEVLDYTWTLPINFDPAFYRKKLE